MTGGNRVSEIGNGKGYFIEPTIFGGVRNEMKIAQEEIFGPVLATIAFDDVEQVAEQANRNPYGLAAAVWTRDIKKAHALSRRLRGGHGVDQHLRPDGCGAAVRRIQAVGFRTRAGHARDRALHRIEERVAELVNGVVDSGRRPNLATVDYRPSTFWSEEACREKF